MKPTLIAALACGTVFTPALHAQETDRAIVITATKTPTAIERVPGSVDVIGEQDFDNIAGYHGAEDLTDLVVGVEAAVANGTQVAFQIRGIGAVDHQALTPTAAAVYSDGVYLATNVQTGLMLYDLERVEILKGPQGALYGRNASGGAVNLIARKPTRATQGHATVGFANYGRVDLDGAIGGAISRDVSARLAGTFTRRDPVLDNVAGPKAAGGRIDAFGLRLSTRWDGPASDLVMRAHYEEDNGINTMPRNDALDLDHHEIAGEGDAIQDTDNVFYGLAVEGARDLGAWTLFSLSALEGYEQNYGFDFDGTPAPFGVESLNANLSYARDFLQLSQEIRLSRDISDNRVMLGAMAAYEDFAQRYTIWCGDLDEATLLGTCRYVGAPGRVGPTPASDATATTLVTDIAQERLALALFTYNELSLGNRLRLSIGARLNHERIEGAGQGIHIFDDAVRAFNDRDGLGAAIGENRIDDTRLTGNAGLTYDVGTGSLYASVANSYKSGGFNGEVANNATFYSDAGLFGAETVTAYEVGYKGRPMRGVRASLAGFYQDYDDPQARIFVTFDLPDGTSIVSNSLSNLDAARSYGVEAQVEWQVARGIDVDAAAIWNATRIDQDSAVGGNADLFDGNPLPFAPEFSGTLGARYSVAAWEHAKAVLSVHAKARSRYFLDPEGLATRSQPAFVTVQAQASLNFDDGLQLTFWGRNLTDTDTAVSGYGFIGYNTFRSDPRTYGMRIGVAF